jgi:hypothetical protein
MQNPGRIQRNGVPPSINISRASEFISNGVFEDPSYALAAQEDGPLSRLAGGDRLEFAQWWQSKETALKSFGFGLHDLLFNPALRYIKGPKTAAEYLLATQQRALNQVFYQGVDDQIATTPGGQAGLTFWFGLVGHLYEVVGINAVRALGLRQGPGNRWTKIMDQMVQLGNPYALASYMGYAANVASAAVLHGISGRYELANLRNDVSYGLVANRQNSSDETSFGQILYRRNTIDSPESNTIRANRSLLDSSRSTAGETSGYDDVSGQADPFTNFGSGLEDDSSDSDAELDALDQQRRESRENHGAMSPLEDSDEINEDGSEGA